MCLKWRRCVSNGGGGVFEEERVRFERRGCVLNAGRAFYLCIK